jgi:hypothetical protein
MRAWSSTTSTKRPSSGPDMRHPRGSFVNSAERTRSGIWGSKPSERPARCLILKPLAPGLHLSSRPTDPSWRQLDRVRKGAVRIVHPTLDCALGKSGNPHPRLSFSKWHHRAVGSSGGPEGGSSPNTAHRRSHIASNPNWLCVSPFSLVWVSNMRSASAGRRDGSGSPALDPLVCASPGPFGLSGIPPPGLRRLAPVAITARARSIP